MRSLVSLFVLVLTCTACADPMNFKFVTSGQNPDDAPIISRTIQGLAVKPATPSDAKIFRDAQNNALVEWKRRGRINYHWRDRAGVPVSEESEYYEVEVYNGSNLVNTYRLGSGEAQPIQWRFLYDGGGQESDVTIVSDGSGTIYKNAGLDLGSPLFGSKQLIYGDFVLEFEVYNDGAGVNYLPPPSISIRPVSDPLGALQLAQWFASTTHPNSIFPDGGLGPQLSAVAGDRFVMAYTQGTIKWYKNPLNDVSPTAWVSSGALTNAPYLVGPAFLHLQTGMKNPTLLRFDTPDWTYTANMQTADGLTPGSSIHLKIYQVSAVAGRGLPLDVTL